MLKSGVTVSLSARLWGLLSARVYLLLRVAWVSSPFRQDGSTRGRCIGARTVTWKSKLEKSE